MKSGYDLGEGLVKNFRVHGYGGGKICSNHKVCVFRLSLQTEVSKIGRLFSLTNACRPRVPLTLQSKAIPQSLQVIRRLAVLLCDITVHSEWSMSNSKSLMIR